MARTKPKPDPELLAELIDEYGRFMSFPEAEKAIGASVRTLKRASAAGDLPAYRIGRARVLRLKTADVAALIQPVGGAA